MTTIKSILITALFFLLISSQISGQTQYEVTFEVDMSDALVFNPVSDDIFITSSFAQWVQPGIDTTYKLMPLESDSMLYTLTILVDSGEIQYKYFRIINDVPSWDNGEWTGDPNRIVQISSNDVVHDIWAELNSGYDITFYVDMTDAEPFNPSTDDIFISGDFTNWTMPGASSSFKLEPVETGSMHYSLTIHIEDFNIVSYKYFRVINNIPSWDYGEWVGDPYREFTIGANQTLYNIWGDISNTYDITFDVDMTEAESFNPLTDDVYITGNFSEWAEPGTDTFYKMNPIEQGSMIYSILLPIVRGDIEYKYYKIINNTPGWDNCEFSDETTREEFIESKTTFENSWGVTESEINAVVFEVDMTDAFPFDPVTEDVYISGSFANWTQPGTDTTLMLKPVQPGSMFYRLSFPIETGEISYKYFRVTTGIPSWENGEWTGDPNRVEMIDTSMTIYDIWGDILSDINFTAKDIEYNMYPNPAQNFLIIETTSDINQIYIFNVIGGKAKIVNVTSEKNVIDITDLKSGVYITKVIHEKSTQSSKFIKN